MPPKNVAKISAINVSVVAACRSFGARKFGTALEIASTPVKDDEPLEKARINKTNDRPEKLVPTRAAA